MNSTHSLHLTVPLGKDAHAIAEQFAAEQATPQKGKQVYLNTLAVYAVRSYLKWLPVETALTRSDSWHPGLRALFDVADLVVPNVGKLECRPVLPGDTAFLLPPEVRENRIGYVAVQFSQQLDSVQLLGFAPTPVLTEPPPEIQIAQLQSLDALIDKIHQKVPAVRLRQWLEGIFNNNDDWQPADLVLAGNFRSSVGLTRRERAPQTLRGKEIYLGMPGTGAVLTLVVQPIPTATETVDIRIRLYPSSDAIHLPEGVQLIVLDEAETPCMEAQARSADDWMQLEFSCQPEERFSVKVILEEMSITEEFIV